MKDVKEENTDYAKRLDDIGLMSEFVMDLFEMKEGVEDGNKV